MANPKVSIVIPSYNRADYLGMTLDSILAQSYEDFEVVFVDDGSTDSTKQILETYISSDQRVKYYSQQNSERAVARSYGASLAQGDYVCFVDSDDLWYPNKLENQVKIMDENPDVVFSYASVNRIDFDNKPIKAASRQHEGESGYVFFDLLMRNFIPSVTPMIRKEILDKVGKQVTDFIPYEDWDFWLRISRYGKFYHIKEPMGDYRIHPGQSVQNVNAERVEEVTLKVLEANTKNVELKPDGHMLNGSLKHDTLPESIIKEAYSLAYLRIAYWYIMAGKPDIARRKLNKSMRLLDYRWYALYLATFTGDLFKGVLASFH